MRSPNQTNKEWRNGTEGWIISFNAVLEIFIFIFYFYFLKKTRITDTTIAKTRDKVVGGETWDCVGFGGV